MGPVAMGISANMRLSVVIRVLSSSKGAVVLVIDAKNSTLLLRQAGQPAHQQHLG